MIIQLTADVKWLSHSYGPDDKLEHVNLFLVTHEGKHILIETGSIEHREEILAEIDEATDGAGLDATVLTHTDMPHSGNLPALQERNDDILVYPGPVTVPELLGVGGNVKRCAIGETFTIAGREFTFVDPPLADILNSMWIFDHQDGILFTGDGFGNFHEESQSDATYDEIEGGVPYGRIRDFHEEELSWLKYVDPKKVEGRLRELIEKYDVRYIAPIHGNPIPEDYIDEYMDRFGRALEEITSSFEVERDLAYPAPAGQELGN